MRIHHQLFGPLHDKHTTPCSLELCAPLLDGLHVRRGQLTSRACLPEALASRSCTAVECTDKRQPDVRPGSCWFMSITRDGEALLAFSTPHGSLPFPPSRVSRERTGKTPLQVLIHIIIIVAIKAIPVISWMTLSAYCEKRGELPGICRRPANELAHIQGLFLRVVVVHDLVELTTLCCGCGLDDLLAMQQECRRKKCNVAHAVWVLCCKPKGRATAHRVADKVNRS